MSFYHTYGSWTSATGPSSPIRPLSIKDIDKHIHRMSMSYRSIIKENKTKEEKIKPTLFNPKDLVL